jgi:hypothetical protein
MVRTVKMAGMALTAHRGVMVLMGEMVQTATMVLHHISAKTRIGGLVKLILVSLPVVSTAGMVKTALMVNPELTDKMVLHHISVKMGTGGLVKPTQAFRLVALMVKMVEMAHKVCEVNPEHRAFKVNLAHKAYEVNPERKAYKAHKGHKGRKAPPALLAHHIYLFGKQVNKHLRLHR